MVDLVVVDSEQLRFRGKHDHTALDTNRTPQASHAYIAIF